MNSSVIKELASPGIRVATLPCIICIGKGLHGIVFPKAGVTGKAAATHSEEIST